MEPWGGAVWCGELGACLTRVTHETLDDVLRHVARCLVGRVLMKMICI